MSKKKPKPVPKPTTARKPWELIDWLKEKGWKHPED
jgi:hypothetical protein